MTNHLSAVQHADAVYRFHKRYTPEELLNETIALGAWGVFSARQIGRFTGQRPEKVLGIVPKRDRTGGRLSPESLPHIIRLIQNSARNGLDSAEVKRTVESGVSVNTLAKLSGLSQTTLGRRFRE